MAPAIAVNIVQNQDRLKQWWGALINSIPSFRAGL